MGLDNAIPTAESHYIHEETRFSTIWAINHNGGLLNFLFVNFLNSKLWSYSSLYLFERLTFPSFQTFTISTFMAIIMSLLNEDT